MNDPKPDTNRPSSSVPESVPAGSLGPGAASPSESGGDPYPNAAINLEKLNAALSKDLPTTAMQMSASAGGEAPPNSGDGDVLEEIADDMLELLRRLKALENGQAQLSERLGLIDLRIQETSRADAREIDNLHRELVGERKSLLGRGLLNAVLPALESLHDMQTGLDSKRDKRAIHQLTAAATSLKGALQGMGFFEFQVAVGEAYDPGRMECLGYVKGEPGIVRKAVRPGYRTQGGVVRPAGVLLGELHKRDLKK